MWSTFVLSRCRIHWKAMLCHAVPERKTIVFRAEHIHGVILMIRIRLTPCVVFTCGKYTSTDSLI